DHARREAAGAPRANTMGNRFGQLDHLDGARPIWQAADEAAFLERRDEAMNAGFRTQVERVLHLVEGRRHAGFLQALMNEAQQFELFSRQHLGSSPISRPPVGSAARRTHQKQSMNEHYLFHMCSATI